MCVCVCVYVCVYIYIYIYRVIPKTLKIVLDTSFLHTRQYKVRIKGKAEQSRERSNTLLSASV